MKRHQLGAESFQADRHYEDIVRMCLIMQWIFIKFVNDSDCRHFPMFCIPRNHFSNCISFHTAVRGSGTTYLVPRCRISSSYSMKSSEHASIICCYVTVAADTDK